MDVLLNLQKSSHMAAQGFERSKYSKFEQNDGSVIWESIQRDGEGGTANWRGEWDGQNMQGVLRWNRSDGSVRDFAFESFDHRLEAVKSW